MDWNGPSSRQAYLTSNGYMGVIQYLGRRGDSTPIEAYSETRVSWDRILAKLETLEEKGLVEEKEPHSHKEHTTYSLTSEGEEACRVFGEGSPETDRQVKMLSPGSRVSDGYMLEGGFIVEGVRELDSDVMVEVTDREATPGVYYVEILERLDE